MASKYDNSLREALEEEVLSLYRKVAAAMDCGLTFRNVCERIAAMPASRFYLNSRYAMEYCRARDRGEMLPPARRYHRALLDAFYDVLLMELGCTSRYDSFSMVVSRALSRPAPSVGLSPRVIQRILHRRLAMPRRKGGGRR